MTPTVQAIKQLRPSRDFVKTPQMPGRVPVMQDDADEGFEIFSNLAVLNQEPNMVRLCWCC